MSRQRIRAAVGTQTVPRHDGPAGPGAVDGPALRPRADLRGTGRRAGRRVARPHPAADPRGATVVRAGGAGRGSCPRALRAPRRREARRPHGGPPDAPAPLLGEGGVRPRGGAARPRRGCDGDRPLRRGGAASGRGPGPHRAARLGRAARRRRPGAGRGRAGPRRARSATTSSTSRTRASWPGSLRTCPTPTRSRRRSRRRSPGACSGRSTRRGCAAPAAAPATWPTTTLRSCPPVRAAGRPTRGKRGNRRRSGRGSARSRPARPGPPWPTSAGDSTRRDCPGPRPGSRGPATGSARPRSTRRRRSAPPRARCSRTIERAETWALPRLGAALYRRQHAAGAPGLTPAEWRRIWAAYRARRPARPA